MKPAGYILGAFAASIVISAVAAMVMSSPQDRELKRRIAIYEQQYPALKADVDLEDEVIDNLNRRDGGIYRRLFMSEAPSADAITAADLAAYLAEHFALDGETAAQEADRTIALWLELKLIG